MAIFGFFRSRMPASSSTFLLTLATVDDLGAIIVLATCFAQNINPAFLAGALFVTAGLGQLGRMKSTNLKVSVCKEERCDAKRTMPPFLMPSMKQAYGLGGTVLWWCLLRAGVSADVAGVVVAMCMSTNAVVIKGVEEEGEEKEEDEDNFFNAPPELLNERLITLLSPVATFAIMPAFALANTAVPLTGVTLGLGGATLAPAAGVGLGLLLGKPLGIFGFTYLATKMGAQMPPMMSKRHLGIVSILGGIGFTMCLLLTDVAMNNNHIKLAILVSSAIASLTGAAAMYMLKPRVA